MQQIKIEYRHNKVIFKVGKNQYFIPAEEFLAMINTGDRAQTFSQPQPSQKYASMDSLERVVKYNILRDEGHSDTGIASFFGIPEAQLVDWLLNRKPEFEEFLNRERPGDLAAQTRRLTEAYRPSKPGYF